MGSENSKLSQETGLVESDIETLREKYDNLCTDKFGKKLPLSEKQFVSKFAQARAELAAAIFKIMDADNAGIITFRNFVIAVAVLAKGEFKEQTRFLFDIYDRDRKGYITVDDMRRLIGFFKYSTRVFSSLGMNMPAMMSEREAANYLFEAIDEGKEGKISRERFECFWEENPDMVDQVNAVFNAVKQAALWDWEKVPLKSAPNKNCAVM